MRLAAGRIPLLEYHLDRLESGCRVLAIPVSRTLLLSSLEVFVAAVADPEPSIIKLIVTRGLGGQGCKPPSAHSSRPSIIWQNLPLGEAPSLSRSGVALQLCRVPIYANPYLAGIKHLNRLNYVLAALDLPENPEIQGLLVDGKRNILETLHHNLFFVKNERLMTPQLNDVGVKGVLRRLILERLAPACALSVTEGEFLIDELLDADEVFLTNGVRGVWPVRALAERRWPAPGPVTSKLQAMVEGVFSAGSVRGGERNGQ